MVGRSPIKRGSHLQRCLPGQAFGIRLVGPAIRLCLKTRSGFERLVLRLAASGCIDDKTNIACFSSLGVARDRLCQAKNRSLSGRRRSFQKEPRAKNTTCADKI